MRLKEDKRIYFALVVTFFPSNEALANLVKLCKKCERVIVIDNTPEETPISFPSDENIIIKKLGKNKGLSYALNYGMEVAKSYQIDEIFLFDQEILKGFNLSNFYPLDLLFLRSIRVTLYF